MTENNNRNDIEDNILYRLEEEEDRGNSSYVLEDEGPNEEDPGESEEDEEESEPDSINRKAGLSLLFKILTTPVEGWKEMKRRRLSPDSIASSVFYPLVALASVSEFIRILYGSVMPLSDIVIEAVIMFMALFFGYFTVILLGSNLLPKEVRPTIKSDIGKNFTMMSVSSLALFMFGYNAFPMIDSVLVFLPLWTIYIVCKGVKILRVPKEVEIRTKGTLSCLIVGTPLLWDWLLSEILNV